MLFYDIPYIILCYYKLNYLTNFRLYFRLYYFKLIYVISRYIFLVIQGHSTLCYYKLLYHKYNNLK